MLFDTAMYLGGDGYPNCARIEAVLRERLSALFGTWIGQQDIDRNCCLEGKMAPFHLRADRLARLIEERLGGQSIVLFGRSSGARVSTLVSEQAGAAAVVCLGYPFRHPRSNYEPERVAHLAHIKTPTLIVQGRSDEYGGDQDLETYQLSPAVETRVVDGVHALRLSRAEWARTCRAIHGFLVKVRDTG